LRIYFNLAGEGEVRNGGYRGELIQVKILQWVPGAYTSRSRFTGEGGGSDVAGSSLGGDAACPGSQNRHRGRGALIDRGCAFSRISKISVQIVNIHIVDIRLEHVQLHQLYFRSILFLTFRYSITVDPCHLSLIADYRTFGEDYKHIQSVGIGFERLTVPENVF
jgi:hypothetical protein